MPKLEAVQAVLSACIGLFTQPFEQDLNASVKAATTAISLAGLEGFWLLADRESRTAMDIASATLVLVLVWMAITAIVTNAERRALSIARNLSVVSFWIAATLVFLIAVEIIFPDRLARAIRFLSVSGVLLVLIPVHMLRNLPVGAALWMTPALWFSTGALAWMVIYK